MNVRHAARLRPTLGTFVGAIFIALCGCSSSRLPAPPSELQRPFPFASRVGNEPMASFIARRTVRVVPSEHLALALHAPGQARGGWGLGAVVAADGYVLTARHLMEGPPMHAILLERWLAEPRAETPRKAASRARVVALGNKLHFRMHLPEDVAAVVDDWALVHLDAQGLPFFELAPALEVPANELLSVTMHGPKWLASSVWGPGGIAWDASLWGRVDAWMVMSHGLAIGRGDSGGPITDRAGRVVGIHVGKSSRTGAGLAVLPDARRLREAMDTDRARRADVAP